MIRRIVAGLFLIYLSLWFGVAYIIEHEIIRLSKYGLSFSSINISGFPRAWKFNLTDPIITIPSSSDPQSFSSKSASMTVNLSLKSIKFKVDSPVLVEFTSEENPEVFQIDFSLPTTFGLKFSKPLIFSIGGSYSDNISGMIFRSDNLYVSSGEEEVFAIEDAALYLGCMYTPEGYLMDVEANFSYTGSDDVLGFESMKLATNLQIEASSDEENNKIHLKNLDIDNLDFIINGEAYLGVSGRLGMPKDDLPQGKFELELQNYPALVDFLWPVDFEMTAKEIKSIISDAANDGDAIEVKMPIIFSDSGIIVNGKNLKELKGVE